MTCSEVLTTLQTDSKRQQVGLEGSLGDTYLCLNNPLFARVRQLVLAEGFAFKRNGHGRYFVSPVLGLDWILENKIIPYRDNTHVFADFCERFPSAPLVSLNDGFEPRHSHVMHESVHCLADDRLREGPIFLQSQRAVFTAILSEAVAQATDLLVNYFAKDEVHYWSLVINHNWQLVEEERKSLQRLVDRYGFKSIFKLMVAFMLYANFHYRIFCEADWTRILSFVDLKIHSEDEESMSEFFRSALGMDPLFRVEATRNYFCANGSYDIYQELIKAHPLDAFEAFDLTVPLDNLLAEFTDGLE